MIFEQAFAGGFVITNPGFSVLDEVPDFPINFPSVPPYHPFPSNQVVQTTQTVHAHLNWSATGILHTILYNAGNPLAEWVCQVLLERMGGAEAVPGNYARLQDINASGNYSVQVNIPAGQQAGLYRISCVITLRMKGTNLPLPVAGFDEGKFIQYYAA